MPFQVETTHRLRNESGGDATAEDVASHLGARTTQLLAEIPLPLHQAVDIDRAKLTARVLAGAGTPGLMAGLGARDVGFVIGIDPFTRLATLVVLSETGQEQTVILPVDVLRARA